MSLGNGIKRIASEFNVGWTVLKFTQTFKPTCVGALIDTSKGKASKDVSLLNQQLNSFSFGESQNGKFCLTFPQPHVTIKKNIIEPNKNIKINIDLPVRNSQDVVMDLPLYIEKEIAEPTVMSIRKQAKASMLLIRKKKMRKHKRNKYRKKFRTEIANKKLKREMEKEAIFQKSLRNIVDQIGTFSAENYINETLDRYHWEKPITRVKGSLAPKWVIKQYLEEKEEDETFQERIKECLK